MRRIFILFAFLIFSFAAVAQPSGLSFNKCYLTDKELDAFPLVDITIPNYKMWTHTFLTTENQGSYALNPVYEYVRP